MKESLLMEEAAEPLRGSTMHVGLEPGPSGMTYSPQHWDGSVVTLRNGDASHGGDGVGRSGMSPGSANHGEERELEDVGDLDEFLIRLYMYYRNHGFICSMTSGIINIFMLGFTIMASMMILLLIDWSALLKGCPHDDTHCDLGHVMIRSHPLSGAGLYEVCVLVYLALLSAYWVWSVYMLLGDVPKLIEMRRFVSKSLGICDEELLRIRWNDLLQRVVDFQERTKICAVRKLDHHDIVSRIMRKDNYLIGMMNAGAIDLTMSIPGLREQAYLTRNLEWNLRLCILDSMFDSQFLIRRDFLYDVAGLKHRFRILGVMNLCLSPFVLLFTITFFFLRNAEDFYHHPGSIGQRRWSELARWRFREFNEMPHLFDRRLQFASKPASQFIDQFPTPLRSLVAKFVTFVAGSFAAFLILLAFIDESLLEARIQGKTILWYAAVLGTILAIARSFIGEEKTASGISQLDPSRIMRDVARFTHYMPSHWLRHSRSSREIVSEFENEIFEYKIVVFMREISSIIITPLMLMFYLPASSASILSFIQRHTVFNEGVGDVCSLAAFIDVGEFEHPHCKVERALVSFQCAYPSWTSREAACQTFLRKLDEVDDDGPADVGGTNSHHHDRARSILGRYASESSTPGNTGVGVASILHRRSPFVKGHANESDGGVGAGDVDLANDDVLSEAHRQQLVLRLFCRQGPESDDAVL